MTGIPNIVSTVKMTAFTFGSCRQEIELQEHLRILIQLHKMRKRNCVN